MSLLRTAGAATLVTGLTLLAAPAQAQYSTSSAWVTPFAGVYFGGSLDGATAGYGNLDFGTSFTWGARLGYKFNQSIGLVFEYAHADPTLTIKNASTAGWNGREIDSKTNVYEGTFNFYFGSTPETMGYIAIGGGADNFSAETVDTSTGNTIGGSKTYFGTVFGLGGQKYFNEKVGMTLDGRYRWVNVNGADSIYCQPFYPFWCYTYDTSWYGSGEITLGVTYKFH